MPRVGRHYGSAELDARDLTAGYSQRSECLEPEDVCHPGRREPVVDRSAELVSQFAECLVAARLHDRGADPHALSPSVSRHGPFRIKRRYPERTVVALPGNEWRKPCQRGIRNVRTSWSARRTALTTPTAKLARDRRVVTFDNAGVGGSGSSTPPTVTQMAHDAIAFLDAMGIGAADILGFSIGSFVAQEIALIRPAMVRRLVLASSAPQGAAGMHGWAPGVIGAIGSPQTSPESYLDVFFTRSAS